ncbi:MAG: hypothetical protein HY000_00475, partial [Planctomycetes bacterium]|nr:hypothetical protein [Planctomycetota bacterium]
MDESELIALIHEAFGDMPHPGDASLRPEACDDHEIQAFYGNKHWQDMAEKDLAYHNAALCFLSPAGFQFFLPAFLVWVIRNYRGSDAFTVDSTIYALDPGSPPDHFKLSKLRLLSPRQRQAVLAFLEFMAAAGDESCDAEAAEYALGNLG